MSNSGAIGRDPAAPVREREAPEGRGEHETPDTRGEHGGLEARGQHETTEAHSQHETTEARGERSTAETNSQREMAESHGSHRAVPQWDTNAVSAVPPLTTARLVLARDLKLAFRKRSQLVQPLAFFAIVTTLFPLGVSPELPRLKPMAAGVVWAAALLSSLLALELLFRDDAQDGTLEQYALSGRSLTWLLAAKTAAHWLLTGLPLALMAPLAGMALGAPAAAVPGIVASVAVGTVALSLIGSVGAGLTLGIRRSGALLSLLTLPLEIPVLIFGARATELAIDGAAYGVPLQLLGALAVLGLTLAPLAAAAAVRINLE